jgi:hypothetical protein
LIWCALRSAKDSGASRSTKPCSTSDGHTAFTRTCGASDRAVDSVSAFSAALLQA